MQVEVNNGLVLSCTFGIFIDQYVEVAEQLCNVEVVSEMVEDLFLDDPEGESLCKVFTVTVV